MRFWLSLFLILALSACGPQPSEPNEDQKDGSYSQDFSTPTALLVHERNGEPFSMASAFLIEREPGFFSTAKHFVEDLSGTEFKIFVNGKVYLGNVAATPAISDLGLVVIGGNFKADDLLSPYKLSNGQKLKVGDTVRVRGFHPHPPHLQMDKILVGIIRGYYGMPWSKNEFVFDDLEAKVSNLALEIKNKDIGGTPEGFGFISNTYIEITTNEDHQFSFGGLSGGPVVDKNNEVVGIVANAQDGGYILEGHEVVYYPWKTIRIVPVEELHKLVAVILVEEEK